MSERVVVREAHTLAERESIEERGFRWQRNLVRVPHVFVLLVAAVLADAVDVEASPASHHSVALMSQLGAHKYAEIQRISFIYLFS